MGSKIVGLTMDVMWLISAVPMAALFKQNAKIWQINSQKLSYVPAIGHLVSVTIWNY